MEPDEERHTYELVEMLDDGAMLHLRCPECGKEVARSIDGVNGSTVTGYRVLRNEKGELLQGNFFARHSWSMNMDLMEPEVRVDG